MSKINANVIVHLVEARDRAQIRELGLALANLVGVVRAQPSRRLERMMLVDYDPRIIDAQAILARVRRRGLEARLIGM
ncbi:hypothetical protein SVA_3648 [Sulfurifustis variabilis]|uniref:Heavy-metal-associated domain-containing protein n=1 Tax=Sulfurifustis variabilis TaxID=1675686 RepID=A0A1B4VBW6_9GAMM|nr:hypothetical protein [Sulfurifustis variabilis]BAU50184.1 hypothetical protein SVA_3648 [Sulfurifustis variabilis]